MFYQIWWKGPNGREQVDVVEDDGRHSWREAVHLLNEYQKAYHDPWGVYITLSEAEWGKADQAA